MKASADQLARILRTQPRASGADLCRSLQNINRSTLARLIAQLGPAVIRCGGSRRTRYALRRPLRGRSESLPLYRINANGAGQLLGQLDLIAPEGSALRFVTPFPWPLDEAMNDGWFDSLPYPLLDQRPQGFLGRNFAHQYWRVLGVAEDLLRWNDDDIAHALALLCHDQPGDLILGDTAYQLHLESQRNAESRLLPESGRQQAYPAMAAQALAHGVVGSSAGGEFPKFTANRLKNGAPIAVIVKFSGADDSVAVRRWSDLLVCEHLALETLAQELSIPAAASEVICAEGRTFLEVERFDRVGLHGRIPVCTLSSLDDALLGRRGEPWPRLAAALHGKGWLNASAIAQIELLWWFGRLVANSDMHEGNLAFHPGLELARAYDMLPMQFAPLRGGEIPPLTYTPPLPLPQEEEVWRRAANAAHAYWLRCAADSRISASFRAICAENATALVRTGRVHN